MLKFCYSGRTEGDARKGVRVGGTLVVREMGRRRLGLYLLGYKRRYVQSIIGATEKRRESGAGVAGIGDIGGSGLSGARRMGVYQDWEKGIGRRGLGTPRLLSSKGSYWRRGSVNRTVPFLA
jgi:hypothetical protein